MKKRGRKAKAINVIKLTEKERKKYAKRFNCKRCHNFFVDTRDELEHHMEYLHGEYSHKKHQEAKKVNRKLHKLYMQRNQIKEKEQPVEQEKLNPVDCFGVRCKNCGKFNAIHMDMHQELQSDISCYHCRMNIFVDNRSAVVNDMVMKGLTPIQYKNKYGIDTTLFKGYEERELKLKVKEKTLGDFVVDRRNGKK